MRASTLAASVGIVGTYWKEGSKKAEAGDVASTVEKCSLPDLAVGMDRFVDVDSSGLSCWYGGDSVGSKDEFVIITLWYG